MTTTTTNLRPTAPRVRFNGLPLPVMISVVVFCLLGIAAAAGRIASTPAAIAVPTPSLPVIVIATAQPVAITIAAPAPVQQVAVQLPAVPRWVVAFASPDGSTVLGPIPEPALSAITGRYGDSWISTMHEGATVWIRTADLGANLANLQPAIAPQQPAQPVYVAAPAAPQEKAVDQPAYQTDNQPAGPPAPPEQPQQAAPREVVPIIAPPAQPTLVPQAIEEAAKPLPNDTEVEAEWARQQWRSEHCAGDECY